MYRVAHGVVNIIITRFDIIARAELHGLIYMQLSLRSPFPQHYDNGCDNTRCIKLSDASHSLRAPRQRAESRRINGSCANKAQFILTRELFNSCATWLAAAIKRGNYCERDTSRLNDRLVA